MCRWILLLTIAIGFILVAQPRPSGGYSTEQRWPQVRQTLRYYVYPDLATKLRIGSGQQTIVTGQVRRSSDAWSVSSRLKLIHDNGSGMSRYVDGRDLNNPSTFGIAGPNPGANSAFLHLNTNIAFQWNTVGDMGPRYDDFGQQIGWIADVYKVALHEFGHWLMLNNAPSETWQHPHPNTDPLYPEANSVMWFDPSGSKSVLLMDDKEAATIMYGIETGFENSQFLGLLDSTGRNPSPSLSMNTASYQSSCSGSTGGTPDYWTYNSGTDGIPEAGPGKNRFMRFRGCAKSSTLLGKAYIPLASYDHVSGGGDSYGDNGGNPNCGYPCYVTIQAGMNLRWLQRNEEGCAVIVSFEFTDGTYLHSSHLGVRDTSGRTITPAGRCTYFPPGSSWFFVQVNFSQTENYSVVGKTIRRVLVVYDNTGRIRTERWRTYFDDVILGCDPPTCN